MFQTVLPFITDYLNSLSTELQLDHPDQKLSTAQLFWFGVCLMGIMLTNEVSWTGFSKVSLGQYSKSALSKMCLKGKLAWNRVLICSTRMILKKFKISEGVLLIDDKNHARSKRTRRIYGVHKQKDKLTGGYCQGQTIVMLYLVTSLFCLPVGFVFYVPDPELSAWLREKNIHKKKKLSTKLRAAPDRSSEHPKKYELALTLLESFQKEFPNFTIHTVLADALYGCRPFMAKVQLLFPAGQMVSQIRSNQIVYDNGKSITVAKYFETYKGWSQKLIVRGGKEREVISGGSRLFVKAHGRKCFIIALKYEGECDYRYLIANNLSWNMTEVMQAYTLRWLIEVFFEDWSCYCGYCSLAKQRGYDGSARPLILSLLFDHCFLMHPAQQSFIEKREPLATLGSLIDQAQAEALCAFISDIVKHEDPQSSWSSIEIQIKELFCVLKPSTKHMNGRTATFTSCQSNNASNTHVAA